MESHHFYNQFIQEIHISLKYTIMIERITRNMYKHTFVYIVSQ